MNEQLKRYISHWAFLPLDQFDDDTSLKSLRPDFGQISKLGMIVDATFEDTSGMNNKDPDWGFEDDEVIPLDSVNDFIKFFKDKGLKICNEAPKGY